MEDDIKICKKCLTLSTRPRVGYDDNGICNACTWANKKKKEIDWNERWEDLKEICDRFRRNDGYWDVLVPCSGGKDGSHVAWMLKNKLNMNPLCVTLRPPIQTKIGKKNLDNFIKSGFEHILINPEKETYRKINKKCFVKYGKPKFIFEIGIQTVTMKIAMDLGIPFIMYGEEGEEEYGGSTSQIGKYKISESYLRDYYHSNIILEDILNEFDDKKCNWWRLLSQKEVDNADLYSTHWSHFENWDPELHYKIAKKYCGLTELNKPSIGTFTTYSQLDDKLQDLHAYMMYIKFGFGRAWSDACIEIRAGRMTRNEGIEMVKRYDGIFPYEYLDDYLEYFEMTEEEFWNTIDSFRSSDIWKKSDGEWRLRFEIK